MSDYPEDYDPIRRLQDEDFTRTIGRAFEQFTTERNLDPDEVDWPEKDQADWEALVARLRTDVPPVR